MRAECLAAPNFPSSPNPPPPHQVVGSLQPQLCMCVWVWGQKWRGHPGGLVPPKFPELTGCTEAQALAAIYMEIMNGDVWIMALVCFATTQVA